jgi:hypothetical protein
MASKAGRLAKSAVAGVRPPKPQELRASTPRKPSHHVVAISLYGPQLDAVDRIQRALHAAGDRKANRSSVIQEAVDRLAEALRDMSDAEVLRDFTDQRVRRTQGGGGS